MVLDIRYGRLQRPVALTIESCHQQPARAVRQRPADRGDLIRRFALAQDDLRQAIAQLAMVVDLRETEVLVRQMAQIGERLFNVEAASLDGFQQMSQLVVNSGNPQI